MSRPEAKPYQVAEVCYNPEWPDMPWYVVRTGTVSEQGGLAFGTETLSFKTLGQALTYLEEMIKKDLPNIKEEIKKREEELDSNKKREDLSSPPQIH